MTTFFVYPPYCNVLYLYSKKLNRYYVGSTQDLSSRLLRHNCGDGCKYTKVGMPWDLVCFFVINIFMV